jgi:hypothetical protein
MGAVDVGQVLAQRLECLDPRCLERVEAVAVVDLGDLPQHLGALGDLRAEVIAEALGRLGLGAGLFLLLGHGRAWMP